MNQANVARWIRAIFAIVPDVKGASTEPDPSVVFKTHHADVVISTWMGARLYVYLLDKAPKTRDLKSILKENSRSGIGTIFIVDKSLFPKADSAVRMQDWWVALYQLNDGFIYTYYLHDDQLKITQAHFTPENGKDSYRIWYLPEFKIEKVTVRRRELNSGVVKGKWYLGDIASPDYKRRMNDERRNQRYHYRTKYTQDIPHNRTNGKSNGRPNTARDVRLDRYYTLIGVERGASEKEIKAAFRQMALKVHPDVSALPRQEANERIKQLNEAYDYIKNFHGWA